MLLVNKKNIGIDISDHTIEVVELVKKGSGYKVKSLGRSILEPGIVVKGRIKDQEKLSSALNSAFNNAKPGSISKDKAAYALPDFHTYTFVYYQEFTKKDNLDELVMKKALENFPLDKSDLIYSYKVLDESSFTSTDKRLAIKKKRAKILIIGARKKVAREWQSFLEKNGIEIEHFDLESISIYRSIFPEKIEKTVCIVDIGSYSTGISIFNKEGLSTSYTLGTGGDLFTKNLADALVTADGKKMDLSEAEKIKIEVGLSKAGNYKDETYLIISNGLRSIIKDIRTYLSYYYENTGDPVSEIILAGGTSKITGIQQFFQENLSDFKYVKSAPAEESAISETKTENEEEESEKSEKKPETEKEKPAEPSENDLIKINISLARSSIISDSSQFEYLEAIGLAMKDMDNKWDESQPVLPKIDIHKEEEEKKKAASEKKEQNESSETKLSWAKEHNKEAQLIIILLVGMVMIAGAFWYRDYSNKQKKIAALIVLDKFGFYKEYTTPLEIAVSQAANKNGRIRGRIIKTKVEEAANMEAALESARKKAELDKRAGEILNPDPISKPEVKSKAPFEFAWVVFTEFDAKNYSLSKVKEELGKKEFLFDSIIYGAVQKTDNANLYTMETKIQVLTSEGTPVETAKNKDTAAATATPENKVSTSTSPVQTIKATSTQNMSVIDLLKAFQAAKNTPSTSSSPSTATSSQNTLMIKETSVGWVNIRSGPGTTFDILGKAYPGTSYEYTEGQDNWTKIILPDSTEGWVSDQFILK